MNNESPDFDLTEIQKSKLFGLGLESNPHDGSTDIDEQKTDMLYDILTSRLPVNPSVVATLPGVVKDLCPSLNSVAGDTIGDLLQNPHTEISTLKRIKWYAKESGISAKANVQTDVYMAVYYAAIANALQFHSTKITRHPYEDLKEFFLSFNQEIWVLEEIKALFIKAQICCEELTQDPHGYDSNDQNSIWGS
jgi:hypothetical protein